MVSTKEIMFRGQDAINSGSRLSEREMDDVLNQQWVAAENCVTKEKIMKRIEELRHTRPKWSMVIQNQINTQIYILKSLLED